RDAGDCYVCWAVRGGGSDPAFLGFLPFFQCLGELAKTCNQFIVFHTSPHPTDIRHGMAFTVALLRAPDGQVTRIAAIVRDETACWQEEQRLRLGAGSPRIWRQQR